MRKFKIFITVLLIYEFAMLTILQIPRYCSGFFSTNFCNAEFKYFFVCLLVPCFVGLFVWWLPEISRIFCGKCQCEVQHEKSIKDKIKEMGSDQEIEHLIAALLVSGARKFIVNHPKTTETLAGVLKTLTKNSNKKR